MLNKEQTKLYKIIDRILWNEWDPLGVNDVAPRDEYQSYVSELYEMLIENRTAKEISERLFKIETETIGVTGSREYCLRIAQMLIEEIQL